MPRVKEGKRVEEEVKGGYIKRGLRQGGQQGVQEERKRRDGSRVKSGERS
jgi:hypothetical protein